MTRAIGFAGPLTLDARATSCAIAATIVTPAGPRVLPGRGGR
jgi:hypothetical protein